MPEAPEANPYIFNVQAEHSVLTRFVKAAWGSSRPLLFNIIAESLDKSAENPILAESAFPFEITCRAIDGTRVSFVELGVIRKKSLDIVGLEIEFPKLEYGQDWLRLYRSRLHASHLALQGFERIQGRHRHPIETSWRGQLTVAKAHPNSDY